MRSAVAGEVGCPDTSGPRRLLLGPGCSEHGRPSGRRMAGALADGRSTDSCGLCQAAPLVGGGCRAPAGLLTPASCRPAGCFRSQVRTRAVCLRSSPSRRQDWSDKRNGKGGGEGGDRSGVGGPSWVSRSAGLNFSLLRAGRAAAFSLLVIHRAGMANQASAEPARVSPRQPAKDLAAVHTASGGHGRQLLGFLPQEARPHCGSRILQLLCTSIAKEHPGVSPCSPSSSALLLPYSLAPRSSSLQPLRAQISLE